MPPKIPTLPPEPIEAIEAAAADWLVLADRGLTAAQQQDFARWLALDPRHVEVFQALESTWGFLRPEQPVARDTAPTLATSIPAPGVGLRFPRVARVAVALAAALVLGVFVWQNLAPVDPAAPFRNVSKTEVGGLRRVELPDGSLVQLNTRSAIEVVYGASERRVRLTHGEAHFTVEQDARRPFIVTAAGVDVRAVGTAFNVRLRRESVDVLVTHGKVNVARPREAAAAVSSAAAIADTFLVAGQRTSVSLAPALKPPPVVSVPEIEIRQALAWQERRLDFDSAPLAEMVAEINRYNHHQLVIADARLETQRFGGSFPAGDTTTFVRLLENNFGVVAERRDDETVLRLPQ